MLNTLFKEFVSQVEQGQFLEATSSLEKLDSCIRSFNENELIEHQLLLHDISLFIEEHSKRIPTQKVELTTSLVTFNKNRKNLNKYYQNK